MTILALDTSNKTLSVAVELTDGTIIEQTIENTLQHSVLLVPTIEAVFKEAGGHEANVFPCVGRA